MTRVHEPDGSYSWLVAIVGAFALVFTLGTPFSYGIFVGPLGEQYGLSELAISAIFSVHLFAAYTVAGVIGVVTTRFPPDRVLFVIGVATVLIAPSLYLVRSMLGLLVVFAVLGSVLGTVLIVIVSVLPQWFEIHRGLGTGVLFVGVGLSLFVMPPAWNLAFTYTGVQTGFFVIIGLSAVSFFGAGLVCKHPPWISQQTVSLHALRGWILQLLRTRRFYYLIFGFGLAFTWFYLIAGFGIPYFEERGLSRALASFAFGSIGGISIASRLGSGAIADRIGYGRTYLLSLACAIVGCVLLFLPGLWSISGAIVFFGLSLGGVTTLYVPIALQVYDPDKSTAIIGIFSIGLGITAVTAPPVALLLVSETGSFVPVITLTTLTVLAAMVLIWLGTTAE